MTNSESVLFELLEEFTSSVVNIDEHAATSAFTDQLLSMKPSVIHMLFQELSADQTRWAAERISAGYLSLIKDMPRYISEFEASANNPHLDAPARAALVGSLAYLVQPRDLLPDDLPGGFGLLDDCLLLHATAFECIAHLPRDLSTPRQEQMIANFIGLAMPEPALAVFREVIDGIRQLIMHMNLLEPRQVEEVTQTMLKDPLSSGPAADSSVFMRSSAPSDRDYFAAPNDGFGFTEKGEIFFHFDEGTLTVCDKGVTLKER